LVLAAVIGCCFLLRTASGKGFNPLSASIIVYGNGAKKNKIKESVRQVSGVSNDFKNSNGSNRYL